MINLLYFIIVKISTALSLLQKLKMCLPPNLRWAEFHNELQICIFFKLP